MNHELKEMWDKDQGEREELQTNPTPELVNNLAPNDRKRREQTLQLMKEGKLITGEDYFHAAYIFHHGETPDDYKVANELAKTAMDLGSTNPEMNNGSKWIYAASLDRYLLSMGYPQKYGTQYRTNNEGYPELRPYDPNTTDEERAQYFVEPISKVIERIKADEKSDTLKQNSSTL